MSRIHKKTNGKIKRTGGERVVYLVIGILFFVYALTLFVPFLWLIMSSFKPFADYTLDLTAGKPFKLPEVWQWGNYVNAFKMMSVNGVSFLRMFFNSLWQTALPITVSVLVSSAFAYTIATFDFKGKTLIYTLVITVMIMPVIGNGGATFKLYRQLGLYDSPLLSIVQATGFGSFLYYHAFFKSVSKDYREAVYIDGGGEFTTFFHIILPQAVPLISSLAVIDFIARWNDYMSILLYLPSYPSVGSGLYILKNTFLITGKDTIYYAGSVIGMLPTLILFIAFSDKIMKNMSMGGLKG